MVWLCVIAQKVAKASSLGHTRMRRTKLDVVKFGLKQIKARVNRKGKEIKNQAEGELEIPREHRTNTYCLARLVPCFKSSKTQTWLCYLHFTCFIGFPYAIKLPVLQSINTETIINCPSCVRRMRSCNTERSLADPDHFPNEGRGVDGNLRSKKSLASRKKKTRWQSNKKEGVG